MLDSIYVAASGLNGHQKGLKNISNDVANMNTPGFKGSGNQFTDVFMQEAGQSQNGDALAGGGVQMLQPSINFSAGEIRATGRDLDQALDGPGFFVLRDARGQQLYTKAGRFELNAAGALVTLDKGYEVLGYASADDGTPQALSIGNMRTSAFAPSSRVTFKDNLSTGVIATNTPPDHTINNVKVYDALGALHTLKIEFSVKRTTDPASSVTTLTPGTWDVKVLEGTTTVGTGQYVTLPSTNGATAMSFDITLTALNGQTNTVALVLGSTVTTNSNGNTSTLSVDTVDGNAAGTLTKASIDSTGSLVLTYSNTLTRTGLKLAVAEFANPEVLTRAGGALFSYEGVDPIRYVDVGTSTKLVSGSLELSNIDLTDQFSTMILIQRGFQASSQVLSTASEMIQSLYDIKSHK